MEIALVFDDGVVAFTAELSLHCNDDRLQVRFDAVAATSAATNRVGLVVLHPADEAGRPVVVLHGDGSEQHGVWPVEISPHQPFTDVAGFRWSTQQTSAELRLTGDVFETEDQRNWTDASFKTYSTPLSEPFPVHRQPGETLTQTATLTVQSVSGSATRPSAEVRRDVISIERSEAGRIPPISLGAAVYPPVELPNDLADLGYAGVLVELVGDPVLWPGLLAAAGRQANALGCGLDVRILTDRPGVVAEAVALLPPAATKVGVFDPGLHVTTQSLWDAITAMRHRAPIELVGGSRAYFTELNRQLGTVPADVPALTYSLTPQMHVLEIDHLIDSLPMQRLVAINAVRLAAGRPVHVGPITLARRFNAVATTNSPGPQVEAARSIDPLLDTDFAGSWTLGSLAALSTAGVESVCYFETAGLRRIRDESGVSAVGAVLDHFAGRRGRPVLGTVGGEQLTALAVRAASGSVELSLGDLSGRARTVEVRSHDGRDHRVGLAPWQVVHVDLGR